MKDYYKAIECEKVESEINRLFDRDLSRAEQINLLFHLAGCKKCKKLLWKLVRKERQMLDWKQYVKSYSLGDDFTVRVMRALKKIPSKEKEGVIFFPEEMADHEKVITLSDEEMEKVAGGLDDHSQDDITHREL